MRTGKVRVAEGRASEIRRPKVHTGEVCVTEVRTGKVRISEIRTGDVCPRQVDAYVTARVWTAAKDSQSGLDVGGGM